MLQLCLALTLAASPELEDGRVAFSRLKYAQAVTLLRRAAADPNATSAERVEAWDLVARSELALGSAARATAAYGELLALDPMASEPDASPKIRAAFKAAKEARFPPHYLVVTRKPSGAEVLEAELVNPWRLPVKAELWEATTGDFARRDVPVDGGRVLVALGPGTRNYLRVVGEDGVLLATLGTAQEPVAGPPAPVTAAVQPPLVTARPDGASPEAKPADAPLAGGTAQPSLTPGSTTPVAPAVASSGWTTRKVLGLTGVIAGGAMLVTGIILLAIASAARNSADQACFPHCSEGDAENTAGALFTAAGVLAAGGGIYLLVQPEPATGGPAPKR